MTRSPGLHLVILPPSRAGEAVEALCDAFRDYPVMRFVLGGAGGLDPDWVRPQAHDEHLRLLVTFFVMARVLRGEPVLGAELIRDTGVPRVLAGVATLTLPDSGPTPGALAEHRDRAWDALGDEARSRYEALGALWSSFHTGEAHHHLNMIGVRRAYAGHGVGRALLDEVHGMAAAHPRSAGVSLTTEDPRNVEIYRHVGYEVTAEGEIPGGLRSWGMFRRA